MERREYRPLPSVLVSAWQAAKGLGPVDSDTLLHIAKDVCYPDGTPIKVDHLLSLAASWADALMTAEDPTKIVPCPEWRCERAIDQALLLDGGCPYCGASLQPQIKFPELSVDALAELQRQVVKPLLDLSAGLGRLARHGDIPWPVGVNLADEINDVNRFIDDLLRNSNRITIAFSGEKNRGKSTLCNAIIGITGRDVSEEFEAFPACPVVNTHVTKEVLLPGGRILDLPGTDSLFAQHDAEAKRRIEDAEAVVLVVSAGSSMLEPEFRFVKQCVLRSGKRRLIIALSKIDALDPFLREQQLEEAINYVLHGSDGNPGILALLTSQNVRIVPVSGRWHALTNPQRVQRKLDDQLAPFIAESVHTFPTGISPCLRRRGVVLEAQIPATNIGTTRNPEKVRLAAGIALGASTIPSVDRALSDFKPPPSTPTVEQVVSRAPLYPSFVTASIMGLIVGFLGDQANLVSGLLAGVASGTLAVVATAGWILFKVRKHSQVAWHQAISSSSKEWTTWVQALRGSGMVALMNSPELTRTGIPELSRAIKDVVTHNAAHAKVAEPLASLRKRAQSWIDFICQAKATLLITLESVQSKERELKRHQKIADKAIESAISTSFANLANKSVQLAEAIVDKEARGIKAAMAIIFKKGNAAAIVKISERFQNEVLDPKRINSWIKKDTIVRATDAVKEVTEQLESALNEVDESLVDGLRKRGLHVKVDPKEIRIGGLKVAGAGALLGGGAIFGGKIGLAIGTSIGGPIGAVIGGAIGIVIGLLSAFFAKLISRNATGGLAIVREAINKQLRDRIKMVLLTQMSPVVLNDVRVAIAPFFVEAIKTAEAEARPFRDTLKILNDVENQFRIICDKHHTSKE